jgi:hypothetical protein
LLVVNVSSQHEHNDIVTVFVCLLHLHVKICMSAYWHSARSEQQKEQTCGALCKWLPMLVEDTIAPVGDTAAPVGDTPAPAGDTAAHVASRQAAEQDVDGAQICCT